MMKPRHPENTGLRHVGDSAPYPRAASALFLILLSAAAAHSGTITGVVRAEGKPAAEEGAAGGKYDSRKFKFVERVNYAEMRDFVVYIDQPESKATPPANPVQVVTTKKITQQGAVFSPRLLPVVVGTTVEWPNNDEIFHNVFSISDAKQFDLGLYKHPEVKRVTFDKPGRVDVFCSIHAAMNCIILVLETPHFSATDDKGRYAIANLPAGTYKLKAWHERLPSQTREVIVPETGEVKIDFTLSITALPQY
jgi:plastocyanin